MKICTTTIFAQLCNLMPRAELLRLDETLYPNKANAQKFDAWDHLVALVFCHIAQCDSLRQIEQLLALSGANLHHARGACPMKRSTLAYANARRDYSVFERFYYFLLKHYQTELQIRFPASLKRPVYSLDSTTITVCMSLFKWARFRRNKGGFKLHTVLSHETLLPEVIDMTDGKVADVKQAREIIAELPESSYVVMDRGYNDYELFAWLCQRGTRFITRLKDNAKTSSLRLGFRGKAHAKKANAWGDYEFEFTAERAKEVCGDLKFRCIQWHDPENDRWFEFLTNDFDLEAEHVAELYRSRWKVELFFKKLKQNLRIKSFVGRTKNAVMNQVWAAMITTLLVELVSRQSERDWPFSLLFSYLGHALLSTRVLMDIVNNPKALPTPTTRGRKSPLRTQEIIPF